MGLLAKLAVFGLTFILTEGKSVKNGKGVKALAGAVLIALALAGCAGGPAVRFSLDVQNGPRLRLDFGATPIGSPVVTNGTNVATATARE